MSLFQKKPKTYVLELGTEVRVTRVIERQLTVEAKGGGSQWSRNGVDPRRFGNDYAYLALGPECIPWPDGKTVWDVLDSEQRIQVTPEYLDELVKAADTEALARGAAGITIWERLIHIGCGAALGIPIGIVVVRLLHLGAVTIADPANATNATAQVVAATVGGGHA